MDCRGLFQLSGTLDNQTDTNFRAINSNNPVFAISRNLGTIKTTQDPIVWIIGFTTDPAIQYYEYPDVPSQQLSLYYKTKYPDDTTLVSSYVH